MDLTNFMPAVEKKMYEVTYFASDSKIKTFIRAVSKENANYLIEQDLKKEYPDSKIKIMAVDDLSVKKEQDDIKIEF